MIAVEEALNIVLRNAGPRDAVAESFGVGLCGMTLAEEICSGGDSPPFDKSTMDGYAIRTLDLPTGTGRLPFQAELTAGRVAPELQPGRTIRIMTGAMVPAGADAVIRIEDTAIDGENILFTSNPAKPGQFILRRGAEMRTGDLILRPGHRIRPQELGLLATLNRATVKVVRRPTVAVLATGDELVDVGPELRTGQIRNSNGPMLAAMALSAGAEVEILGIARDDRAHLAELVGRGVCCDILVLSGGVSAGKLDLVPDILRDAGVVPHFHHVAMKPGKPLFFGTRGNTLVFGLPGNPVSSFCGFELFVRPALRAIRGIASPQPNWTTARLREKFSHSSDRPTYHPARMDGGEVLPVRWIGSPDLRAMSEADTLLKLPAGTVHYSAGDLIEVLMLERE